MKEILVKMFSNKNNKKILVTNKNLLEALLKNRDHCCWIKRRLGAREAAFRTTKNFTICLTDEPIAYAAENNSSYAIRKKTRFKELIKPTLKFFFCYPIDKV